MSTQIQRSINENISEDKAPLKGSISLYNPKRHPNGIVTDHRPANEMPGIVGKE